MATTLILKPLPRSSPEIPFSWDDLPSSPEVSPIPSVAHAPSPPTLSLPAKDMKMFGMNPMRNEYSTGVVRCKQCGKPTLRSAFGEHAANCIKIKSLQTPAKKSTKSDSKKSASKRKADDEPEGEGSPKKKKAAPKVTKGRFKGPIDLDKQCGVINDKGLPCSRSLTCKSHAMGAKRAVQGRSRGYDELLLDWQRQNNPNFVEPVKRETKKEKKEKRDREREEKKKLMDQKKAANPSKKSSTKKGSTTVNTVALDAVEEEEEDIDSEAEMDAMIQALKQAETMGKVAVPMAVSEEVNVSSWYVVRRERLRCCRDQLLAALKGGRGGIGGGVPAMMRP